MKKYNKPGPAIWAIQDMNRKKPLLLPEGCGKCRFFKKYRKDNKKADGGLWVGECVLARGRLCTYGPGMDEVSCPLEFLEGVDNRIWEKEDTNPWFVNISFFCTKEGMEFQISKIKKLKEMLEIEEQRTTEEKEEMK